MATTGVAGVSKNIAGQASAASLESAKLTQVQSRKERVRQRQENRKYLDTSQRAEIVKAVAKHLADNVIEQFEACHAVLQILERVMTMRPSRGPAGSVLIAGKTGVGKNKTAEELARAIGGEPIVIACTEYQEKGSVASLIGSPPGYVGHGETTPKLTQERIDKAKGKKVPVTVIVLDEFEKAHPDLWNWCLKVLDDGKGDIWRPKPGQGNASNKGAESQSIDFSNCVIIATSNAGAELIGVSHVTKPSIGFGAEVQGAPVEHSYADLKKAVEHRIREKFGKDELLGRFNALVVARDLSDNGYRKIMNKELRRIRSDVERATKKTLGLKLTSAAKDWLLQKSNRKVFGARQLSKCMDNEIGALLSRLVSTEKIREGDLLGIDFKGGQLVFDRSPAGKIVKARSLIVGEAIAAPKSPNSTEGGESNKHVKQIPAAPELGNATFREALDRNLAPNERLGRAWKFVEETRRISYDGALRLLSDLAAGGDYSVHWTGRQELVPQKKVMNKLYGTAYVNSKQEAVDIATVFSAVIKLDSNMTRHQENTLFNHAWQIVRKSGGFRSETEATQKLIYKALKDVFNLHTSD